MGKELLKEVVVIRLFLLIALVLYHAFAPFSGAWSPISDADILGYGCIAKLMYAFLLESFVFISGYVYGYQRFNLIGGGKKQGIGSLIKKKFLRLMVPSIVFSILYILIFGERGEIGVEQVWSILNGAGHLWFLPMLFFCFILCYILQKLGIDKNIKLFLVIVLAVIPFPSLPLRINLAFHYLLYFYMGFIMKGGAMNIPSIMFSRRGIILQWIVFGVIFAVFTLIKDSFYANIAEMNLIKKSGYLMFSNVLTCIYSFLGVVALYSSAIKLMKDGYIHLSDRMIKLSQNCFGVYIFQQFILQWIYYHTDMTLLIPVELVPWIGFIIALTISLALSVLMRKTRIGRYLLG